MLFSVTIEDRLHQGDSRLGHNVRQSNRAIGGQGFNAHELTKVTIDRDQCMPFRCYPVQKRWIAWVWTAFPGFDDVVSLLTQPIR